MGEIKLPEPAGYLHAGGYKPDFGHVYREFEENHRFGEGKYPLYTADQMRAAIREKDAEIERFKWTLGARAERAEAQRDAALAVVAELRAVITRMVSR